MNTTSPKVGVARGWRWMTQAVSLVTHNASVFLPMGAIAAVIYLIPLLGGLIMLILGPALIAGSIIAARDAVNGNQPKVGQMFALFQEDGRLRDALKLCIPLVIGKVVASLILVVGVKRVLLRAGLDLKSLESQSEQLMKSLQGSAGDLFGWSIVSLLILLVAWAFTVTAISRVALDRSEPFAAMAESFRLALRNAGAWLLATLVLFLAVFVLAIPLLIGGHLALTQMLINVLIYSLLGPLLYFAWRDLAQTPDAGAESPPSAPPPGSSAASFEA